MSRPLFVGSYLQVTWWDLGQSKGRKNASNDNKHSLLTRPLTAPWSLTATLKCISFNFKTTGRMENNFSVYWRMQQELHLTLLTRKKLQDLFTQSVLPEVVGYVNLYCIAWQSKAIKGKTINIKPLRKYKLKVMAYQNP